MGEEGSVKGGEESGAVPSSQQSGESPQTTNPPGEEREGGEGEQGGSESERPLDVTVAYYPPGCLGNGVPAQTVLAAQMGPRSLATAGDYCMSPPPPHTHTHTQMCAVCACDVWCWSPLSVGESVQFFCAPFFPL